MGDTFSLDPKPSNLFDVPGFRTGAASCGLKGRGPDIGVLVCENADGAGAAVLTKNTVRASPVRVSSPRAMTGLVRAAVVSAGNANCYTGEDGLRDAREMVELASSGLDVPQERVLVASNGVLGSALPMDRVRKGIEEACRDARETGRGDFAAAIAATDIPCKVVSVSGQIEGKAFIIAGVARPAGLAPSEAATTFAFLATDLAVSPECLNEILISVSERTFDRLLVDGGKGTNDTLCLFASGRAGNELIDNVFSAGDFAEALEALGKCLVAGVVPGGDPATSPLEIRVSGAESERDAEIASRAVGQSVAVRSAIGNRDPNWGLVLTAAGRSAARVEDSHATVRLAGETVYEKGQPVTPLPEGLKEKLGRPGVTIELDIGLGSDSATIWVPGLPGGNQEELQVARRAAREAAAAIEEAEKRRAEVEDERSSLHGKLEEEASARKAATRETQVLRKRLDSTEEARTSLEAGRKETEAKLKEAASAREIVSKESKELTERLEAVRKAAEQTKAATAAEREALEKKFTALEGTRKKLEGKLEESESARESTSSESKELTERIKAFRKAAEETKAATAAERKALEEKLSSTEKARASLEAARKELEGKLKEAESARGAASDESKELSKRLESAKAGAEMAEVGSATERKALEEKLKEKESAQASAAKEAGELRVELKKTGKEARATIVAKRGEFEAKLKELESTREAASGESKSLTERLEAAERAAKEAKSAAKVERKDLTAKLKEADSARAAAAKEAEGLRSRLEKTGDEAKAAAEAELKELQAKLKETASAAEDASRQTRADAAGERDGLEAKLEKAESAREAALKEAEELKSSLKLAEEAAKEAKAAAKSAEKEANEATKRADKEATTAAKSAEKEAKAAAKAAAKEAKGERKELEAKLKAVAGGTKEIDDLTAEITKRDEMIAALQPLARDSEMHLAEARRYWEEGKKVSERLVAVAAEAKEVKSKLSLRDQLIEQLKGEEGKHEEREKDLEKQIEELRSKLKGAGGGK